MIHQFHTNKLKLAKHQTYMADTHAFLARICMQHMNIQMAQWRKADPKAGFSTTDMDSMISAMHSVIGASLTHGLYGFARLCACVCRRLEFHRSEGELPDTTFQAFAEWLLESERFLKHPQNPDFAKLLVDQLNDPRWGFHFRASDSERLLQSLAISSPRATV